MPPETSAWEIFADVSGKRGKEKRVKFEKKRRKIVKGKVENWKLKNGSRKIIKSGEDLLPFFFFLFCFSLLKTTEICFGSTKMGIFYQEKTFHAGKKIRKNDFAPSEKYACYAPGGYCKLMGVPFGVLCGGYTAATTCTVLLLQ